MITEEDFYAIAQARPDTIRAFCAAVLAVVEMRKEAAAKQSDPWAEVRLKKKQSTATSLTAQFASGLMLNGQPISEAERKIAQSWILRAADFHMLPKEEQDEAVRTGTAATAAVA